MKVLITGASGFIGQHLIRQFLDKGIEVNILTRNSSTQFSGCSCYVWDPYKKEIDEACFDGVTTLIHLAGATIAGSWSKSGRELIINSRVIPTQFLIDKLSTLPHTIKHVVAASAIGIYANLEALQTEEDYYVNPHFLGEVVQQWEVANMNFKKIGLEVALVRIGLVLDKNFGALPKMSGMIQKSLGSVLGSGSQYYSWIHIEDLVRMLTFIVEEKLEGIYNGVAPTPVTNREFMNVLAKQLKCTLWMPAVPEWMLKCLLGDKSVLVLDGQQVGCQKILRENFVFRFPKLDIALADIYV
ncbi:MAG: TIGR01777 family oxidoreductase [Flavobacteriaceae bacterium]|nr:TIGR01777 family oxidoreductase [Flavobacteriaceae bacterium]